MRLISVYLLFSLFFGYAQGPFHPPVDSLGTSAIHKDSSIFVGWAVSCEVERGYQDIQQPQLGWASTGEPSFAIGKAGVHPIVSLGDGGIATLMFSPPITNGDGWDFAVFENSFNQTFLELAFVEVSSDGLNYFRFPATSLTQTAVQIDAFGSVNATEVNNLAGKYRANYGTPFDLEELKEEVGLNVESISHVRIVDVVGSLHPNFATLDKYGNSVNDPYPTPFPSSGFDLDAVGVIHQQPLGVSTANYEIKIFPNPSNDVVHILLSLMKDVGYSLLNSIGEEVYSGMFVKQNQLSLVGVPSGMYFLTLTIDEEIKVIKLIRL
jgi:hypothetical protein